MGQNGNGALVDSGLAPVMDPVGTEDEHLGVNAKRHRLGSLLNDKKLGETRT